MSIAILFVDDEENILSGLKRSTRSMRSEWDMTFVTSGAEGLEVLARQQVDVVVSDLRMPQMDGAEFLDKARKVAPATIRFVLSGHADLDMAARSVRSAHRFLTKPCNASELKLTIDNALCLRRKVGNVVLHNQAAAIAPLPSIPENYQKLVAQLADPEVNMEDISATVSEDISMAASILKIANSSFFGKAAAVESISKATIMLGVEVIKNLVLANEVFSAFDNPKTADALVRLRTLNTLRTALNLELVTHLSDLESDRDQAMAAAVLQDIGTLVFLRYYGKNYGDYWNVDLPMVASIELQQRKLGYTSHQLAAYILSLWGLPDHIIEAVDASSAAAKTNIAATCILWSNALIDQHFFDQPIDPGLFELLEGYECDPETFFQTAERVFKDAC